MNWALVSEIAALLEKYGPSALAAIEDIISTLKIHQAKHEAKVPNPPDPAPVSTDE
jgi:hypothetical protein